MKKTAIATVMLILIATAAAGVIIYDLARYADTPIDGIHEPAIFEIPRGLSFKAVARNLEDRGLIENSLKLLIIARYTGQDKTIRFGEYRIEPGMSPRDVLDRFSRGEVVLHRVTIPEGFNMRLIALRLEAAGLCESGKFLALAMDPAFVQSLQIPADTLEGYLFPDTYYFEKNPSVKTVIRTMVGRFNTTFTAEWKVRAAQLGFSIHDIVTLASIIEKETGHKDERTVVSSVFHNRLNRNMRLDSDPTVIYGIEAFDGRIRTRHLREMTPYNTYMQKGLPPGPIASPGFGSLHAALYPAETDYLFFVAKSESEHHFSKTYEEHRAAVQKYILGK
jgi:UPF0755 protein